MERKKYEYFFRFTKQDGKSEDVAFTREVTNDFYAVSYVFDWLIKYELDYGKCIYVSVYEDSVVNNVKCDYILQMNR